MMAEGDAPSATYKNTRRSVTAPAQRRQSLPRKTAGSQDHEVSGSRAQSVLCWAAGAISRWPGGSEATNQLDAGACLQRIGLRFTPTVGGDGQCQQLTTKLAVVPRAQRWRSGIRSLWARRMSIEASARRELPIGQCCHRPVKPAACAITVHAATLTVYDQHHAVPTPATLKRRCGRARCCSACNEEGPLSGAGRPP